ncbi:MAG: replication restart helicase PriA [Oscillospiraceae bacterium]
MAQQFVASVAVSSANFAIDKPYDYVIPPEHAKIFAGMRVMVPFGRGNHMKEGIVLALRAEEKERPLKAIAAVLDEAPVLDTDGIQLALWMHDRCFCTVYDAVKAMLPTGLWFALQEEYRVAVPAEKAYEAAGTSAIAIQVLDVLFAKGGGAPLKSIRMALGNASLSQVLYKLVQSGVLAIQASSSRNIKDRTIGVVRLASPSEEALQKAETRKKRAPAQYAVVCFLAKVGEATMREVHYFTGVPMQRLHYMARSGILTLEQREYFRRPDYGPQAEAAPITLNEDQTSVFEGLRALCHSNQAAAALLYGVTGSGKTLVYLKLIQDTLSRGKSAMLLVPEIALTPQLLQVITAYFGSRIAVLHSSLRPSERYDEWKRIRKGEADVVVGTRSAVFAPLQNLGLIVMDEEQEYTYQSDQTPRYHARDIAKFRCVRTGALLLLGSATPSVESYYHAKRGTYHLFQLPMRYNEAQMPSVLIADMKEELRQGNGGTIGAVLRDELTRNLENGQQSILYLNRRGNSHMATCGECGTAPSCPHCSVYLTYHSANERLMCHHCGYSQPMPNACQACGGQMKFIGAGTQKVQDELQALFPGVEILRMDTDTVSAAGSHRSILERFAAQKVPILIGTQMVTKGLNFPSVTLVGVISADLSLYIDDYRAGERTFSLLTQVVGRAGRGQLQGRAVIQTYMPEHEVILHAARQDYDSFYQTEIALRKLRDCPPFCDLFTLSFSGTDERRVMEACAHVQRGLQKTFAQEPWLHNPPKLWGPAPAYLVKLNDRYRYRLVVAFENREPIRRLLAGVYRTFQTDKISRNISLFIEVNGWD